MKWYSTYVTRDRLQFIIDDEGQGAMFFVYEDAPDGFAKDIQPHVAPEHHQRDYSQDDLAMAKRFGFRKFGVPLDSWKAVEAVS